MGNSLKNQGKTAMAWLFAGLLGGCLQEPNRPPSVNAGSDRQVLTGEQVTLQASAEDRDGDSLVLEWRLQAPAGSASELVQGDTLTPSFVADTAGEYRLWFQAWDGLAFSELDQVRILASDPPLVENRPPTAVITTRSEIRPHPSGKPFNVFMDLDGSASYDVDGQALSYHWRLLTAPAASKATLNRSNQPVSRLKLDAEGVFTVELVVSDGLLESRPVQIDLARDNFPPTAVTPREYLIFQPGEIILDAGASFDPDGHPLNFQWRLLTAPAGSNPVLVDAGSARTGFSFDLMGEYELSLHVDDGELRGAPLSVRILPHALAWEGCADCHDNQSAPGKPPTHPVTDEGCQRCHATTSWAESG